MILIWRTNNKICISIWYTNDKLIWRTSRQISIWRNSILNLHPFWFVAQHIYKSWDFLYKFSKFSIDLIKTKLALCFDTYFRIFVEPQRFLFVEPPIHRTTHRTSTPISWCSRIFNTSELIKLARRTHTVLDQRVTYTLKEFLTEYEKRIKDTSERMENSINVSI
jgi:hypothetical protein